ncbi:hypothetical protein [Micromonospora sp. WMMD737]|uniref:hypothetical protein n=1 Tax=Micromonospora sp. WMMD737 TaxID=3404113 RepID=UPI003B94BE3A
MNAPTPADLRPLLDLDLGHAAQYGYRRPEDIPTRDDDKEWPVTRTHTTRTTETEAVK